MSAIRRPTRLAPAGADGSLNRWFEQAWTPPAARVSGRGEAELHDASQGAAAEFRPVLLRADAVPESYRRYLVNSLREFFEPPGTPVRHSLREKADPSRGSASGHRERTGTGGRGPCKFGGRDVALLLHQRTCFR